MIKPRGIVICVNYDDILRITLPWNLASLSECCVITSTDDARTSSYVRSLSQSLQSEGYEEGFLKVFETDAFTRYGARFNKGLAMEEGLDFFGRHGWMLIWDADTAFPRYFYLPDLEVGNLYGAKRRMIERASRETLLSDWAVFPIGRDIEFAGFFQLFHASDFVLRQRPWYDPTFIHAGGGDAFFQSLWGIRSKIRLDVECLHIGPRDQNWYGRVSPRFDGEPNDDVLRRKESMLNMKRSNGWIKDGRKIIRVKDRVKVPGYTSTFFWHRSNPETDVINP